MESEWLLKLAVFGAVHWVLVGLLLPDLARRGRVIGGRKLPWALLIIFIACFGSLVYLLFHPQIFSGDGGKTPHQK